MLALNSCRARQCPLLCRLDLLGQREGQSKCERIGRESRPHELTQSGRDRLPHPPAGQRAAGRSSLAPDRCRLFPDQRRAVAPTGAAEEIVEERRAVSSGEPEPEPEGEGTRMFFEQSGFDLSAPWGDAAL